MACLKTSDDFTIVGLPDKYRNRNVVSKDAYTEHIVIVGIRDCLFRVCVKLGKTVLRAFGDKITTIHFLIVYMFVLCRRNIKRHTKLSILHFLSPNSKKIT